jgi:hypothetical protein
MSKATRRFALFVLVLSLSTPSFAASSDPGGSREPSLIQKIVRVIRHLVAPNDETLVIPKP